VKAAFAFAFGFGFAHHLLRLNRAAELVDSLLPVAFPVFKFLLVAGGCALCIGTLMVWGDTTTIKYKKKFWMDK
jgi:hypothetical protein